MELEPLRQIGRRFAFNVERVSHLLLVFDAIKNNKNLKQEYQSDVLRSAVVLLHATLEDLLREMIRIKVSQDPIGLLQHLEFTFTSGGSPSKPKISVEEITQFRGMTVDDLIERSIADHLSKRSFNHQADVVSAIKAAGLEPKDYAGFFANLSESIDRRHRVVHEGDRVSYGATSHGRRRPLAEGDVRRWLTAVSDFGKLMLKKATPS